MIVAVIFKVSERKPAPMVGVKTRIRRAEYTGINRCWPCTVANGVVLSIGVVILTIAGRRTMAAGVALVGVVSIWLRGYLVPYTPRYAPRLLAMLPFDFGVYGDHTDRDDGSLSDTGLAAGGDDKTAGPTGDAIVTTLLEAGVVVPDDEEFLLQDTFRDEWRREMTRLRDRNLEGLAEEADALTEASVDAHVGRDWRGRATTVRLKGEAGHSVSLDEAVVVAELAATRALRAWIDDAGVRRAAGRPLRSLLERCPRCDGELTVSQATCCGEVTPPGSTPTEKLVCPACDVRLFTYD